MNKSTRKHGTVKLQVVNKKAWAALQAQPLLQANPQAALPLLAMIGQAQLSIEDMLGQMSRQFVEQLLVMAAESVAGPKHPGKRAGEVRWYGKQGGLIHLGTSKLKVVRPRLRGPARQEKSSMRTWRCAGWLRVSWQPRDRSNACVVTSKSLRLSAPCGLSL